MSYVLVSLQPAEDRSRRLAADEPPNVNLRSTLAYHGPGATPLILAMLTCQYEGAAALVASGLGWTGIKVCCVYLHRAKGILSCIHSPVYGHQEHGLTCATRGEWGLQTSPTGTCPISYAKLGLQGLKP